MLAPIAAIVAGLLSALVVAAIDPFRDKGLDAATGMMGFFVLVIVGEYLDANFALLARFRRSRAIDKR
jgi:hypothetical protein